MLGTSHRALTHFRRYLPDTVSRWLLFHDGRFTSTVAEKLALIIPTLAVVDLRHTTAEHIEHLDRAYFPVADVGALFLSIFDATRQHDDTYLSAYRRLNVFDTWPSNRCRIVDETTDRTFDALFDVDPEELRAECLATLRQFRSGGHASFRSADSHLAISYAALSGTAYTGFEAYEFNLPSGEVAFKPTYVKGHVSLRGWIIGSIPFGQKHGHIERGELQLSFDAGRITAVRGSRTALVDDLTAALEQSPGLREVNEFGIGLHRAAAALARRHTVGLQWMEKCRGLHLGLGAELGEHIEDHRLRRTHHHLDLVFEDGELSVVGGTQLTWP